MIRFTSPYFCAGVVFQNDIVKTAAPILFYMEKERWTREHVIRYAQSKQWEIYEYV